MLFSCLLLILLRCNCQIVHSFVDSRFCNDCVDCKQIHDKGLKFGIYGDVGTHTCTGYPGNAYHMQLDAETYANWTVDYFKMDGCYWDVSLYDEGAV